MAYDIGTARGVIEMDYNGRGITQAKTDLGSLDTAGAKTSKTLNFLKSGMAQLGIGLGLAAVVKTVADFEQGLSGIAAVSGATGAELDALRAKALQLGADTSFSATEAASAMEELVKAGLSVDEVLNGAADAAVALAAAGGIPIAEAATIASNAMNQFNLTAGDLGGVVDNIAGAANASAIDVSQLGQSLTQAGAVANLAGLSFEDTATAIALMGNAGIVGSDAGTSLKTMLQNLQPTTTKQIDLFKELNLLTEDGSNKFFDAQGNIKSYAQVSQILADALEGQGNQQKLLNLETLFGTDAIRAAAVAADAGAKGVRDLNDEMNKTTAAEVAAKRLDNFSGSLEELGGSIETALILGTSGLLGLMRDVVDGFTAGINAAVKFGGYLSTALAPGFEDIGAAIANVINLIISIAGFVDELIAVFARLTLGAVIVVFNTLASVLETVTGLLEGQGAVIATLVGTWLLLANGGIAVVAARLGWFAAYAVVQALSGLTALTGGAAATTAALKGLAAMAATATASLGAVALLVAAVTVWNAYKEAVEETEEALKAAAGAKESGTFTALSDEVKAIEDLIKARQEALDEYAVDEWADAGKFLNNAFNPTRWGDVAKLDEFDDSMSTLKYTAADLQATLDEMGEGVTGLASQFGLIDPTEAEALMTALSAGDPAALTELEALMGDMQPLLDQAGISAMEFQEALKGTGDMTLDEVQAALTRVTGKAGTAASATMSLSDAAAEFANDAASAADAAKAMEEALDNLIGVELNADQAAIQWREGLRSLREQIASTSGALNGNTAESDANRESVISSTQDILDRVAAEARAGTSLGKITNMFRASRQELIANAVEAGANKKAMVALLEQYNFTPKSVRTLVEQVGAERARATVENLTKKYHLTPEEVKTIFEAAGAKTADEQVQALRDHIKELKGKNAPVETPGAEESNTQIERLREQIRDLQGKDAKIGTPGATESAAEIQRLRDQIALLQDKQITITTTVRRVIENVGADIGGAFGYGGGSSGGGGGSERMILNPEPAPVSAGVPPPPAPAQRTASGGASRRATLVDGELRLDPSGKAFISGVALEADDDGDDYDDTLGRMN